MLQFKYNMVTYGSCGGFNEANWCTVDNDVTILYDAYYFYWFILKPIKVYKKYKEIYIFL